MTTTIDRKRSNKYYDHCRNDKVVQRLQSLQLLGNGASAT